MRSSALMPPDRLGRRRKRPSGGDAPRYPPRRAADVAAPPASQQPRPGMPPLPHPLPQWRLQSRCSSAGDHATGPWIAPPKRAAVCEKEPLTTISRQPQKKHLTPVLVQNTQAIGFLGQVQRIEERLGFHLCAFQISGDVSNAIELSNSSAFEAATTRTRRELRVVAETA
jgi:hypothetical protein